MARAGRHHRVHYTGDRHFSLGDLMSSRRPESIQRARFGTASGELAGTLLGKVFGLLAFSLAFAAVGGVVGAQIGRAIFLPAVILEFGLLFAVQAARNREGLNFVL